MPCVGVHGIQAQKLVREKLKDLQGFALKKDKFQSPVYSCLIDKSDMLVGWLVGWLVRRCFEPSQPWRIISGLTVGHG